jgi:hypothetical protein
MNIIRTLDDVTLVPTPVKTWQCNQMTIREEMQACLFEGKRAATLVLSNVYGEPFVDVCWLNAVQVLPRPAGGNSPWQIRISRTRPGRRKPDVYYRDFPVDMTIIAWGRHDIDLGGLPPLTAPLRWHCRNFAATWREVSDRVECFYALDVGIDTTAAAITAHESRRLADGHEPPDTKRPGNLHRLPGQLTKGRS